MTDKRLKDRTVFTVNGENGHALAARFLLHQLPGHHHGLLVGQGHPTTRANGGHGRDQACSPHDGRDDQITLRKGSHFRHAVGAIEDVKGWIVHARTESLRRGGIGKGHEFRTKRTNLLFQLFVTVPSSQSQDRKLIRKFGDDVEGAVSNGAR